MTLSSTVTVRIFQYVETYLSGRPKTSEVWGYGKCYLDTNCSECIRYRCLGRKMFVEKFAERNPRNLKSQLQALHTESYSELKEKEDALISTKKPIPTRQVQATPLGQGQLRPFYANLTSKYPSHSDQHDARVRALTTMVAETSIP